MPNGIFVDEHGIIRYAKYGGFSVDRTEDRETIRKLIDGEPVEPAADPELAPYHLTAAERALVEARMQHGSELLEQGEQDAAVAAWQSALELDPQNFVIRKQIWAVRYPERFQPTIDWDWQRDQLQREREAEIARGVCGADGCPRPRVPHRDSQPGLDPAR